MKLSKVLVTCWEKIDGVWKETRKLKDVSKYVGKYSYIAFDIEEMRSEDSYIRDVEFIYEMEDK